MTSSPASLRQDQTVEEAAAFFEQRWMRVVPVIDESGRPVGKVSRADVGRHRRPRGRRWREVEHQPGLLLTTCETRADCPLTVRDVMTADVDVVPAETSAMSVAERMLQRRIHDTYVVDQHGVLIGHITAWDLLRLTTT